MTSDERKQFGIFVGFFNRANNTTLSVNDALRQPNMLEIFNQVRQFAIINKNKVVTTHNTSTRRESFNKLDVFRIDRDLLEVIKNTPGITRSKLAQVSNVRVCTVAGAVKRLIDAQKVFVSGKTYDFNTRRTVECLKSIDD